MLYSMAILVVESLVRNNSKLQAAIRAMEVIFLFAGLVSAVRKLKNIAILPAAPSFNNAVRAGVNNTAIWFKACWFSSPLRVYVVINFIVVLIVASTIFRQHNGLDNLSEVVKIEEREEEEAEEATAIWEDIEEELRHTEKTEEVKEVDWMMMNKEEQVEKNIVGSEGDDDDDSMEAMWKAITEGAEKAVSFNVDDEDEEDDETRIVSAQSIDSKGLLPTAAAAWRELRKSVTFNDAISVSKRGGLMRDDPSMSLDSFNRRVIMV